MYNVGDECREKMIVFRILAKACLILLVFTACKESNSSELDRWMLSDGKLKVLCTIQQIADLVQEIGKEQVDCLTLIQGESDPHSYQLVKGDDEKFLRADLIFYNGLGLEHGHSLAQRLRNHPQAFSIGDLIASKHSASIITYKGAVDPHIWMDVALWQQAVPIIQEKLSQRCPEQALFFQHEAEELSKKLNRLQSEIEQLFQHIPEEDRYLVTAHEAFNYFVRAYLATEQERQDGSWTIRSMAPEGLAPDSQLSTQDIQKLVEHIVQFHVRTIFAESNVSRDSLKKLLDACSQKGYSLHIAEEPLYVDAMGPKGSMAGTYDGMLAYDAETIAKGLSKR